MVLEREREREREMSASYAHRQPHRRRVIVSTSCYKHVHSQNTTPRAVSGAYAPFTRVKEDEDEMSEKPLGRAETAVRSLRRAAHRGEKTLTVNKLNVCMRVCLRNKRYARQFRRFYGVVFA